MTSHPVYDYCIIGTGAGGGILAHKLAKAGLKTISIEQGPELTKDYFTKKNPPGIAKWYGIRKKTKFPPDPNDALFIHDLFANHTVRSSSKISEKDFHQFQVLAVGGLQNLWNGVSVRFSEEDMKDWPVSYKELDPHYSATEERITVCGTVENLDVVPDGHFIQPKPLRRSDRIIMNTINRMNRPDTHVIPNRKAIETRPNWPHSCISTGICTFGCPASAVYKFSTRLLPEIRDLDNYTLLANTKVIRLIRDKETNRIKAAECLDTKTKKQFKIKAKNFIISTGAVESPRLLFNSHDKEFPEGLANSNKTLGLYLQDNPKVIQSTSLLPLWGRKERGDIGYGDLLLILSKGKLKNDKEFGFIGHAIHAPPDVPYYLEAMKWIPKPLKKHLARLMFHSYVSFGLFCEGDLSPTNKVTPSEHLDRYGIPQIDIQYSSSDEVLEKMEIMARFGRSVLRRSFGTIITEGRSNDGTGIHYAGTCRMSKSKKTGIVNKHLQTFDHENLFICDGSVIPHLPDKHLTLTIMALADRLGDYLIKQHNSTSL